MRRWVVQWSITITWARPQDSPVGSTVFQTRVATPARLRYLIERARADPGVVSHRHHPVRELVGEPPVHCPAGHTYDHNRRDCGRLVTGWAGCVCGGHFVLACPEPGCPHPRVYDPPVAYDCEPQQPG